MRILVIEDVDNKYSDVCEIIEQTFSEPVQFNRSANLNDGEDAVMQECWDLVIVDLSMDINGNGSIQGAGHATLGGLDILERMALLKIDYPTILVTGFDSFQDPDRFDNAIMNLSDISSLAERWLGAAYVGSVRYGVDGWSQKFRRVLQLWKRK
jgi:CheY-like chemotaxis protein